MNVVDKFSNVSSQEKSIIDKLNDMIDGESAETKSMKNLIAMVSQTDSTALILGETGTGKDIVAQAIHKCSKKKGPFFTVNCAEITSELLESELKDQLKEARLAAQKVILEAEEDSDNLYKEALALANADANASREKARREIDLQRDDALNQLKSEADTVSYTHLTLPTNREV